MITIDMRIIDDKDAPQTPMSPPPGRWGKQLWNQSHLHLVLQPSTAPFAAVAQIGCTTRVHDAFAVRSGSCNMEAPTFCKRLSLIFPYKPAMSLLLRLLPLLLPVLLTLLLLMLLLRSLPLGVTLGNEVSKGICLVSIGICLAPSTLPAKSSGPMSARTAGAITCRGTEEPG